MTVRKLKIKGEQISFLSHADESEILISGTATGETPTGWNFKVKGNYIYWVDKDGAERNKLGTLTGGSRTFANFTVHGEMLYFGDEDGNERSISAEDTVIIDTSSPYNGVLVRASDGTLWAIYTVSNVIYARTSSDDGATWGAAETVATEGYSTADGPEIDAVMVADIPHLVYTVRTGTSTQRTMYHTHRTGGSWSVKEDVFGGASYMKYPRIAADSSGAIHVVFRYDTNRRLGYVARVSGTWGSKVNLDTSSVTADYNGQDICVDSNGFIHIVYVGRNGAITTNDLFYLLNNGSWQARELIAGFGDAAKTQTRPTIAVDSGDALHVVWAGVGYDATFKLCYITGNTGAWGAVAAIGLIGTNSQYRAEITINAAHDIDVCWSASGYPGASVTGNHIKYTGGAWSAVDVFSDYNITRVLGVVREENLLPTGYMVIFYGLDADTRFYNGT